MPNHTIELPFGEMVKIVVAALHKEHVPLPFKDQKPWHMLFYTLKEQRGPGKPAFFDDLIFDWDGYYPKCEELADFLNALHVTANVSALNPGFNAISVDDDDAERWSQRLAHLNPKSRSFVTKAVELARTQFQAAAE